MSVCPSLEPAALHVRLKQKTPESAEQHTCMKKGASGWAVRIDVAMHKNRCDDSEEDKS